MAVEEQLLILFGIILIVPIIVDVVSKATSLFIIFKNLFND